MILSLDFSEKSSLILKRNCWKIELRQNSPTAETQAREKFCVCKLSVEIKNTQTQMVKKRLEDFKLLVSTLSENEEIQ